MKEHTGIGQKILGLFSEVRSGEAVTVLLLLADIFLLLLGYYILKTVREPMILVSAANDMQLLENADLPEWLHGVLAMQKGPQLAAAAAAVQGLLLVGFIPLYSWFTSKVSRLWLLVGVTGFFISNMILFYIAALAGVPFVGFFFYAWVGVFSVAMVAQFWSFANDVYSREAGERLFPIIAIGATAGSPTGSYLAGRLSDMKWSAASLILLSSVVLVVYLVLSLVVHFRTTEQSSADPDAAPTEEKKLEKKGGFALVLRNPYILGLGVMMLLLNFVNTGGEYIVKGFLVDAATSLYPGDSDAQGAYIGSFYGSFYTGVNIIAFLMQALLVSRIVKYVGMRGVVLMLPIVAFGAYGLIGLGVGIGAVRWAKTAENSTDYSVMNTGKAMLWLPTTREEKYKAKQAVDTVFVRTGDLCAAILFIATTSVFGWGYAQLAWVNLGLIVVWIGVAIWVIKRHALLAEAQDLADAGVSE